MKSDAAVSIRQVCASDRDEWIRMRSELYRDCPPEEIDDFLARMDSGTHLVGVAVFVAARAAGGLGGFVEIGSRNFAEGCTSTPVAFLEGWYVDPDLRRSGVGRRLVAAAEDWARARGFTEMASDTELENVRSLRAHLALGYEEVERQICFRKRL